VPWWSWLIVWAILGLVLLITLGSCAIMLWGKLMRTLNALDVIGKQLSDLDIGQEQNDDDLAGERTSATPAVFLDRTALLLAVDIAAAERRRRKQRRRDRLITHGKLISHPHMIQRTEPHAW